MTPDLIPPDILVRLKARYAESHRYYHTWAHVKALLNLLEEVRGELHDPHAVELAILYHDAIYDPRSEENEAMSAALMADELGPLVRARTLARANTLILETAGHQLPASGEPDLLSDCALFLDMDLSILGADQELFDAYEKAIREEYHFVPVEDYRQGRSTILEDFLGRERLYFSSQMHRRLDRRARENLKRSLKALKQNR